MQLLRHFTIRRVVLWMMILSLAVVALAGIYSALTQQLTFLTRAGLVMQDGTAADKADLLAAVPADAAWDGYRTALSAPDRYPAAERPRWLTLPPKGDWVAFGHH
ncbi:hypothetical protein PUG81_28845 [Erwiniaceae bacterium L1_54_6]|jgi:methyl-accepting chemotaxis protein|nr:hypothetical protein [Erwiniaceae bacterium L1_54_6]